jgi:RNA polymerase sigma-70 factor (ECF subfamily)
VGASDYDIAKLQALDDREWERLREEYHDRVFGFLRRQVGDVDLAEDLTQDAFLGAVRGIKGFDPRYNVEQYLMGIARNKAIDQLRRKKVEVRVTDRDDDSSGFFSATPAEGTRRPSQIHAARETVMRQKDVLVECLRDMVQELRDRRDYKKLMAIELCFLKDWKHRDIAKTLGIGDEKAIAGIKFRAIRDLQLRLMKRDPRRTLFSGLWREA